MHSNTSTASFLNSYTNNQRAQNGARFYKHTQNTHNMYKLFFTDRQRKATHVLTFTKQDMHIIELHLNVLRDAYKLPEFTELQDGSFVAENAQFKLILEETTVEPINTIENGNTYF